MAIRQRCDDAAVPRVSSSVVIDRPVAEVFAYVEDWTHAADFTESLVRWEPMSEATAGVGARFTAAMRVGPTTQESTIEIVRRTQDEEIAWESRSGFEQKGAYRFSAVGAGTRVDFEMDVTVPGGIAGRLLVPIIDSFARANTAATLAKLKRILET